MNNIKKHVLYVASLTLGTAIMVQAALPLLEAPAANVTEKWVNGSGGWGVKDLSAAPTNIPVNCWVTNQLKIQRSAAQMSAPKIEQVVGGTNASNARYTGDYALKSIDAVTFDVRTAGLVYNPLFVFKFIKEGVTNSCWQYASANIPMDTSSNWVHVSIPMAFSTTWMNSDYYPEQETPASAGTVFDQDKKNIVEIMFNVASPKTIRTSEQFAVTNLKLIGPWGGPFTNGVPVAWLAENGFTNVAAALQDTDGDGQLNNVEFLASTNPNDSNDVFKVTIAWNAHGKPVLRWKENNTSARYDLLEGTDMSDTNSFKGKIGMTDIQGSGTQKEVEVDAAQVTGPRFYKIQVRVP